jgi:hypothetical protein
VLRDLIEFDGFPEPPSRLVKAVRLRSHSTPVESNHWFLGVKLRSPEGGFPRPIRLAGHGRQDTHHSTFCGSTLTRCQGYGLAHSQRSALVWR